MSQCVFHVGNGNQIGVFSLLTNGVNALIKAVKFDGHPSIWNSELYIINS